VACRTFALKLEYDGSGFGGSQYQTNARTVQEELEQALLPLAPSPVRVSLAGRTDAGVHAAGQVASALLPARWSAEDLQRALNARLPQDLAVVAIAPVPDGFDPRRWALWRRYAYRIWNAQVRSPLRHGYSWHVRYRLDVPAMRDAAALLEGVHDFASFAGPLDPPERSTVREMHRVAVVQEGALIALEFEGNAFLPHQVRRTVGALVEVGRGRLDANQFRAWLNEPATGAAGPAAPPCGLCLVEVGYETLRFEAGEQG
jgi:tRNA pseudouridine38-40 synthase